MTEGRRRGPSCWLRPSTHFDNWPSALLVAGLYAAVTGGWEATFGKTMLGHHADRRGGVFLLIVGMALVVLGARLDRRAERRRDDSDRS